MLERRRAVWCSAKVILLKLVQIKEAKNVFPCPGAGSSSCLLKFLGGLLRDPSCPRYRPPSCEEPSALGAGAEAGARLTGSNYQ